MITFKITFISKELESVSKYHILDATWPRNSVRRTFGQRFKGYWFISRRGQAYFSACPMWIELYSYKYESGPGIDRNFVQF